MIPYAHDLWQRAGRALRTARCDGQQGDPDAAASRAYYAAFYAVSALFALENRTFRKHSAVEVAVHRELIRPGRCPADLGSDYRSLRALRNTGDYGALEHVTAEQADEAIHAAERILAAVAKACPRLDQHQ